MSEREPSPFHDYRGNCEISIIILTALIDTDINECANDTLNGCLQHDHQVCANTLGSFSCDCEPGFQQHEDEFCQG